MVQQSHLLSGISGWLLVPALGLIFSPIFFLLTIFQTYAPMFTDDTWGALTNSSSDHFLPGWGTVAVIEILLNSAVTAFGLWIAYLFFRHDARTPRMFILWLLAAVFFLAADLIMVNSLPTDDIDSTETVVELIRSAVNAAIWIPYFMKSERVKNTFTEFARSNGQESQANS